jgi:hypothetical protein
MLPKTLFFNRIKEELKLILIPGTNAATGHCHSGQKVRLFGAQREESVEK